MKSTKTKLISSVTVLLICFAMLIGSTFAWFTDSASTGVNKIQAGNLNIEAYYQNSVSPSTDGALTFNIGATNTRITNVSFESQKTNIEGQKLIDGTTLFEPGYVGAKLITVENEGNLAAKIAMSVATNDQGLMNALWFDFVMVNLNQVNAIGTFEPKPMNTINTVASNIELDLDKNDSVSFIFIYGMDESAGNEFQGKSFEASVTILARQNTVENDSYGNQYDQNAVYPVIVSSQDAFSETVAASNNSNIVLSAGTYTLPEAANKTIAISGTKETVIDLTSSTGQNLSGTDLTFENVTVKGINQDYVGIQHSGDIVYNNVTFDDSTTLYGESVTFNNCTFNLSTRYIWTYGAKEVTFNNCTFNTKGKAILIYAENGVHSQTVNVNGCTFNATEPGYTYSREHCAAVEIDASLITGTYTVNFTGTNTVDSDFNGIYRIKKNPEKVTINRIN